MSWDEHAGKNNIKIGNTSIESMEQFRYLGTTLTYQNSFMKKLRPD
jgi:hypothetical protein